MGLEFSSNRKAPTGQKYLGPLETHCFIKPFSGNNDGGDRFPPPPSRASTLVLG